MEDEQLLPYLLPMLSLNIIIVIITSVFMVFVMSEELRKILGKLKSHKQIQKAKITILKCIKPRNSSDKLFK